MSNNVDHQFSVIVTVRTDRAGASPSVVDVDWGDSHISSHLLDHDDVVIEELDVADPAAVAACAWLDSHTQFINERILNL